MNGRHLGGRRSSLDILREILSACKEGRRNKSGIAYYASLDFRQASRYISLVCQKGYLFDNYGRYTLTPKGEAVLIELDELYKTIGDLTIRDARPATVGA